MLGIIRRIGRGFATLLNGRKADTEITDELRHFLDQSVAEYERRGLSHDEARRAATIDMGGLSFAREEVRSFGWEHVVETFCADVHYALRRLRRAPGFTATAIITLALGIGASTTVFSVISPVLIEPLPFPHASELVTIDDRTGAGDPMPVTFGTFDEMRARARSYAVMAAADNWRPSLIGTADPEQLRAQRVTSRYFGVYGVAPAVGRDFTPEDEQPGAANVVVLSDGILNRRFGGDRSILGKTIDLDGVPHTVIGIMPPGFANIIAPTAELWAPLRDRVSGNLESREWGHHYKMIARLAPGATVESALRETVQIGRMPLAFARPSWANMNGGLLVRSMQDDVTGPVRPSLLAILGAVVLLLAITAVNVTNLLLARGSQRRAEMAMRLALGASRGRIVRQLLTESVVLAFVGGLLGLLVARLGVGALVASSPAGLPRSDAIHVSARVFVFAFALTAIIGLVVGLLPALGSARAESADGLHQAARPRVGRHGALRNALVVAEVSLALVLLVAAGLMYRSVTRLMSVAPGIEPAHVVTMQVIVPRNATSSDSSLALFFDQAVDAVRRLPGVTSAAFTSQLPLSGDVDGYGLEAQALPESRNGNGGSALRYSITPDYFTVMGIPLREGRLLAATDRPGASTAVVINESLARRLFGRRNPIGERLRFGPQMGGAAAWDEVVGVVGDVKHYTLAAAAPDAFYVVNRQWSWMDNTQTLVVRASGDATALVPSIKRAVWSISPIRPIQRVRTMDSFVAASAGARRFVLLVIETFAVAALLLAAVGLYGVIAGHVIERMREIGIRAAMGAAPTDLVRSIVVRSVTLAGAGALVGLPIAFGATRFLQTMLFGISRIDVPTYGAVIGLVVAVAALAAWSPARRAAGVDPTIALRSD